MRTDVDSTWTFNRYQEIRPRLPAATFPEGSKHSDTLQPVSGDYDVFVFDSFGVLNVGNTPVQWAAERIKAFRNAGKRVFVLTNSASLPSGHYRHHYQDLGYDFEESEIITSRTILTRALPDYDAGMRWAVGAPENAGVGELPCRTQPLDEAALRDADGFMLLSSSGWTEARQRSLMDALDHRPRPLLIGNPDLVAPNEAGFYLQPGAFAHEIADALGIQPHFFGKPFGNAFDVIIDALPDGVDRRRILMVGDTLHTDILGGAAAGFATALVTKHGVMRDMDVAECIAASGIRPDLIVPEI